MRFYILYSWICTKLRFWLFKFLDLAWNWNILRINSWFLLEDILKIEHLIEHILICFSKFRSETLVKRVYKPYIYLIINVDLGVEGVFCSPWQLSLGVLSILNLACNWDFVFYILGSCLNLRFWLFKFLDLAWYWDILWQSYRANADLCHENLIQVGSQHNSSLMHRKVTYVA